MWSLVSNDVPLIPELSQRQDSDTGGQHRERSAQVPLGTFHPQECSMPSLLLLCELRTILSKKVIF